MRRLLVSIAALAAMHSASLAQTLSIDGVWGNPNGCKYEKDGLYENDDMMVLKPDGVQTYVLLCEWLQVLTAKGGNQVVTGICGHEGEGYETVESFIVQKDQTDPTLVRIYQSTGDMFGEVRKCP